jgi:predicted RNA-binding protein
VCEIAALCCVLQASMSFWLKMSGGDVYELRTEAVLYVTPRLAMSVEEFYAQKVGSHPDREQDSLQLFNTFTSSCVTCVADVMQDRMIYITI